MRKVIRLVGIVLFSLLLILIGFYLYLDLSTRNSFSGTLSVPGLIGKVTITRDQYGIPHIYASQNELDAYYALGFVQAQDRFWQMDMQRHIAQGSLSEYFGLATLKKDEFLRTWQFYHAAEQAYAHSTPEFKTVLQHYAAGVNAFLQTEKLPIEYKILRVKPRAWTPVDSLAWAKMMAFDLDDSWTRKIKNYLIQTQLNPQQIPILLPPYPKQAPTILSVQDLIQSQLISNQLKKPYMKQSELFQLRSNLATLEKTIHEIKNQLGFTDAPSKGSNNWVLNGKMTVSHLPLLANDPHLGFQIPALWYLAEIKAPNLHVMGATLPGLPGVIIGRNDHIAWGVTNSNSDTQDLFMLKAQEKITQHHEEIKIKGHNPINFITEVSQYGPVISNVITLPFPQKKIAIKWTALADEDDTALAFYKIDHAKNWAMFTEALSHYNAPAQNFVYADKEGNIGYYLGGNIPIRQGCDPSLPILASESCQWQGVIPFKQLPHVYNPQENFLASANNKPAPDDYPYYLSFRWYHTPYRIQRIIDLISQQKPASVSLMKVMQNDKLNLFWLALKPHLNQLKPQDSYQRMALTELQQWSGTMDRKSVAATIYAAWYEQLIHMAENRYSSAGAWQEPLFILQQLNDNGEYCRLPHHSTCDAYLQKTFVKALGDLRQHYGNHLMSWQWGSVHSAEFKEMGLGENAILGWFFNRHISTGGGFYTLDPGSYYFDHFVHYHGAGYRQIINFADLNQSLFMVTPGESGNIFSPHYDDLLTRWRNGQYIKISANAKDWGKTEVLNLSAK
ncbi:MAG: penicillin acylase family protein [Legionellales bacterium]|nr:penicillin acylase family protein [Legionellales bacterium]